MPQTPNGDLKSGLMQILPADGIQVKLTMQTMSTLVLLLLSIMLVALFFGRVIADRNHAINCRSQIIFDVASSKGDNSSCNFDV